MSRHYDYAPTWAQTALEVKERARWKCEHCGVPHDALIVRDKRQPGRWRFATDAECLLDEGVPVVRVVLSVHHIGVPKPDGTPGDPDDKLDNRPENLVALCARCHLIEEVKAGAARKAAETRANQRRQRQLAAGQGELF